MNRTQKRLSVAFKDFFESEKSSGIVLIVCTTISLWIANSSLAEGYMSLWQIHLGSLSIEHWVNEGLMAVFFLLVGLELEREIYIGELSNLKNALLPIFGASGGILLPALIHYSLNAGTPTQSGVGIPMATDIAFALGAMSLLGSRIPDSLKVFVVAFAVIDDLGAVIVIAIFYTGQFSALHLTGALSVWGLLFLLNRLRIMSLTPYLLGGVLMWVFMLLSGVHATIAGVLLAFSIPFSPKNGNKASPSNRLEHLLQKPVAFMILPIFALANTGVPFGGEWIQDLTNRNSLGIITGLFVGKPLGITLFCVGAVASRISRLPPDLNWGHIFGAGILGGIGFTMSIFITNLAFAGNPVVINTSKIAIFSASLMAGVFGFLWLRGLARGTDQVDPKNPKGEAESVEMDQC